MRASPARYHRSMRPYSLAPTPSRSARALAFALALGLPLVQACEGGGSTPEPTMTYAEYVDAYEQTICEWRVACKLETSVDQCREWFFVDRTDSYTSSALAAGTIVYHGDKAQPCLDELAARTCGRDEPLDAPTCAEVLEGRVAPEDPCMIAAECALNGVCGKDPNCVDMCCAGECRVLPEPIKVGEDCSNPNRECEAGTFCAIDDVTFMRTVCTPRIAVGGACGNGLVACIEDAYCDFDTGVCAERLPVGSPCDNGNACAPPARCEWNGFTQYCYAPAALGEACDPEVGYDACKDFSTWCNPSSRICELAADVGQPCAAVNCVDYAYCDGQICQAFAAAGQPCGFNGDYDNYTYVPCGGNLVCDNDSACVTPAYPEDACEVPGMPYEADTGE